MNSQITQLEESYDANIKPTKQGYFLVYEEADSIKTALLNEYETLTGKGQKVGLNNNKIK